MSAALAPFSFAADVAVRRPPQGTFAIPGVKPASALEVRPAPDMVPFGIAALDALTGGIPRGALTEMVGSASSGRTSITMSLMAEITRRQEVCAVIDASDSFDPLSAEAAGVDLDRVLWVRCGKSSSQQSAISNQQSSYAVRRQGASTTIADVVPGPRAVCPSVAGSQAERERHAIAHGCFEASRGRREPASLNSVAPPAKNISWSIHENYDARLRHAFTRGNESQHTWSAPSAVLPRASSQQREALRPRNFAQERAAKWNRLDQVLKATDLLIQSGGFGLIVVDLGDIPSEQARRIPLTSWFRFRRAVENTPTILLVIARDTCAKTCASLVMNLSASPQKSGQWKVNSEQQPLTHICLLDGLQVEVELARTRLERKPVRSAKTQVQTETIWRKLG